MIEWVNNIVGFRNIIAAHWGRRNLLIHSNEVKESFAKQATLEKTDRKGCVAQFESLLAK